jgi:hypothetical protein
MGLDRGRMNVTARTHSPQKKGFSMRLRFLRSLLFQNETCTMHPLMACPPLGPLCNFHQVRLLDEISRLLRPHADEPRTETSEDNEVNHPWLDTQDALIIPTRSVSDGWL